MLAKLKFKGIKLSDKLFIVLGLAALVIIIFSQQIQFTSIDLGRHLANGHFVWSNPKLLYTNFYSYTETNFPFINHHWFSGVIFYFLYILGGFKVLSAFNILLALSTFFLAFRLSKRRLGFYGAALLALPVILMMSERVAIRPEAFSYLFIFIIWSAIEARAKDRNFRRFYWLAPLFLLWINIHIYFIFGLALVGFKAAAEFLASFTSSSGSGKERWLSAWSKAKPWFKGFAIFSAVSLINPHTWRGLLYPFAILHDYGYQIVENKTIFYLSHLMVDYNFLIFKILLILLALSLAARIIIRRRLDWWSIILSLFFAGLGCFAFRNIALFGLASMILISGNLTIVTKWLRDKFYITADNIRIIHLVIASFLGLSIVFLIIFLSFNFRSEQDFIKGPFGWGIADNSQAAANFFKNNDLPGPVFNNYDIGSALIFWLYPSHKVFVDNRPEAYGQKFFSTIYKPIQSDPAVWKKLSASYGFKSIFFGYTDATPWARSFVRRMLSDPDWSLVYFDTDSIIMVNKKTAPDGLVKKVGLDDRSFRSRWESLAGSSRDLRAKFNLTSLAILNRQSDLAESLYKQILFSHPDNRQALESLASVYASYNDSADLEASLSYYSRALQAGDNLPGIYDNMAMVYWRLSDYKQAAANWQAALRLDRHDSSALDYLGQIKSLQLQGKLPLFN